MKTDTLNVPGLKTITLTDQDLNIIAGALGALPYAQVAPLIDNIQTQLKVQAEGLPGLEALVANGIAQTSAPE